MPAKRASIKPARSRLGSYVTTSVAGEAVKAYIPVRFLLIPQWISGDCMDELSARPRGGQARWPFKPSPDTNLLLYSYVRKEAVLSSQIEGTQSSLSELLLFEKQRRSGRARGRCRGSFRTT